MKQSGGRRIKRSLLLDANSVRRLDDELYERLRGIDLIRDYLEKRRAEVEKHNEESGVTDGSPLNGRSLTNLGTFREYISAYLDAHPKINHDMTFLVRQLAPAEHGIPIEIYVFSAVQDWAQYESIQADIFDHLLAATREFELEVYQVPSGQDVRSIRNAG